MKRIFRFFSWPAVACVILAMSLSVGGMASAADGPMKIVAFGDSLTAGLGLPQEEAFPTRLQKALVAKGVSVEIVNAGVSGDTASAGLARLDWSVPDGTDAVILALGANDMLRGIDPAITRQSLEAAIQKLQARKIKVLLIGMKAAPNLGTDYAAKFNAIYPDLAAAYKIPLYPFFLDGVAADRTLNQNDGMHPNAKGVEIIVERMLPTVEKFVNETSAGS